jgi:hypothetical protein
MPYRKKGQRSKLLDLAKKSRERAQARRDAKAKRVGGKEYVTPLPKRKSPAQARKFGARIPVGSRSPATKAQTPKRKKPEMMGPEFYRKKQTAAPKKAAPKRKAGVAPRTTRTPARRAADKKMWQAMQKEARKESESMRYGSEYKGPPKLGKKEQDAMARSMEFGSGGGLVKVGVGSALTALGLKAHKWHKAKKAADLASGKTGGQMAGIGSTRSGSAASRTSGLGTKTPKKTPKKKKKSALSSLLKLFKGKPKSAFEKTPKKKTQRRYPK